MTSDLTYEDAIANNGSIDAYLNSLPIESRGAAQAALRQQMQQRFFSKPQGGPVVVAQPPPVQDKFADILQQLKMRGR